MRLSLALSVLFLGLASAAHAQTDKRFERADVDHDGRVTLQDYESYVGTRLMEAKGPRAQRFRSLDPEQQATVLERRFHRLDKDHKGYLVPEDFARHQG